MVRELQMRIIIENPVKGVEYGLQKGKGSKYETVLKQKGDKENLHFPFTIKVMSSSSSSTVALQGPFVQGSGNNKYMYIDIGTFAGQENSPWSRRLKIPLSGISDQVIKSSIADPSLAVEAVVPGTGGDGGPACGTVKSFRGWKVNKKKMK